MCVCLFVLYVCVFVVIEGDYAVCMQHLMRFPALCEVNYLVQRALHLRNPVCGLGVARLRGVVILCGCVTLWGLHLVMLSYTSY